MRAVRKHRLCAHPWVARLCPHAQNPHCATSQTAMNKRNSKRTDFSLSRLAKEDLGGSRFFVLLGGGAFLRYFGSHYLDQTYFLKSKKEFYSPIVLWIKNNTYIASKNKTKQKQKLKQLSSSAYKP